jgi:serine/threonine-protein kinase RsbW
MPPAFELSLPPTAAAIGTLMDRLEAFVEEAALPPQLGSRLMLVCEELAANVAEHAAGASSLRIAIHRDEAAVRVAVEDDGPAFDPLGVPEADTTLTAEERGEGGLGLHLIRKLAQDVRYARVDNWNRVSLVLGMPG